PALRRQAHTLILLKRDDEAAGALDRYLKISRGRTLAQKFEVYKARGYVHSRLGQNRDAIKAYTEALKLREEGGTLNLRGWAHLAVPDPWAALADFEAVPAADPAHSDALCGRAHALVRLGKPDEAVAAVQQAVRAGPCTVSLLVRAAGVHARV